MCIFSLFTFYLFAHSQPGIMENDSFLVRPEYVWASVTPYIELGVAN